MHIAVTSDCVIPNALSVSARARMSMAPRFNKRQRGTRCSWPSTATRFQLGIAMFFGQRTLNTTISYEQLKNATNRRWHTSGLVDPDATWLFNLIYLLFPQNTLQARGHIYSAAYSGWYCVSDETFLTDSQIRLDESSGTRYSLESGHPVEWTEETNYMFRLTQFQDDVRHWVQQDARIRPAKFEKILLDTLSEPLPDVSVSRPASRVHWAIPVPNDSSQTVYVWLDALINYLSSLGYPDEQVSVLVTVFPLPSYSVRSCALSIVLTGRRHSKSLARIYSSSMASIGPPF